MKTKNTWQERENDDYYDPESQSEVQYTSSSDDEPPANIHPTFATHDIWCAATIAAFGVELLEYRVNNYRSRGEWIFDNTGDEAWNLGREFRMREVIAVPVFDLRDGYRKVAAASQRAREGAQAYGYGQEYGRSVARDDRDR